MSDERVAALSAEVVADETMPQVVRDHLARGGQLEDITLHAEGWWSHQDGKFVHERLIEAFFHNIDRTEGGTWIMRLGRFTYPITVEDTGFFITRLYRDHDRTWVALSDGSCEPLDVASLVYGPDGRLVARVKGERFEARFMRPVYHALLADAQAEGDEIWLELDGQRVRLIG